MAAISETEELLQNTVEPLEVTMFGSFTMTYQGRVLMGGKKSSETQFAYLMQLLLHYREQGVAREQLEQVLFGDRDIENAHHAVQSVIYNAKKKLEKFGLPPANYITFQDGFFRWTDEIPVKEDAEIFSRLYEQAEKTTEPEEQMALYNEACYVYGGEFLSLYAGIIWAGQEARRYRNMFYDCVNKASQLQRVFQDYFQMEELGRYASKLCPFSDWESLTMEALVATGRCDEAQKFYADTVDLYFREQGLRPSRQMIEMLDKLSRQIDHPRAMLEEIQKELAEDESIRGGYLCSYPVFRGIYHMVQRMMERGGQSVYLMLCTVVDSKGNIMTESERLDELTQRLGDAICRSIRHGDAVNRYGKGQYLVLLVNTSIENCAVIQRRINRNFIVGRQRTGIQYYVSSVVCEP